MIFLLIGSASCHVIFLEDVPFFSLESHPSLIDHDITFLDILCRSVPITSLSFPLGSSGVLPFYSILGLVLASSSPASPPKFSFLEVSSFVLIYPAITQVYTRRQSVPLATSDAYFSPTIPSTKDVGPASTSTPPCRILRMFILLSAMAS